MAKQWGHDICKERQGLPRWSDSTRGQATSKGGTLQLEDVLEAGPLGAQVGGRALAAHAPRAVHQHATAGQQLLVRVQPGAQVAEAAQARVECSHACLPQRPCSVCQRLNPRS